MEEPRHPTLYPDKLRLTLKPDMVPEILARIVLAQAPKQPGPGEGPVALRCSTDHAKRTGRLIKVEPREEAKLDQRRSARVDLGQFANRLVEVDQVVGIGGLGHEGFEVERLRALASTSLEPFAVSGAIENDSPHGLGGSSVEVTSVVPGPLGARTHQPEIGVVNESRGLKRLARALVSQPGCGQPTKFVVNQGQEVAGSLAIAQPDGVENLRDRRWVGIDEKCSFRSLNDGDLVFQKVGEDSIVWAGCGLGNVVFGLTDLVREAINRVARRFPTWGASSADRLIRSSLRLLGSKDGAQARSGWTLSSGCRSDAHHAWTRG